MRTTWQHKYDESVVYDVEEHDKTYTVYVKGEDTMIMVIEKDLWEENYMEVA